MMLYTDPGSGVLIWQLIIAVVFGATFYFTKLRHWAMAKFKLARTVKAESVTSQDLTNSREQKIR